MSEYDYSGFDEPKKTKTFVNDDEKTFWEAFSSGTKDGEERSLFTGNIQTISAYLSYEREREKIDTRER